MNIGYLGTLIFLFFIAAGPIFALLFGLAFLLSKRLHKPLNLVLLPVPFLFVPIYVLLIVYWDFPDVNASKLFGHFVASLIYAVPVFIVLWKGNSGKNRGKTWEQ